MGGKRGRVCGDDTSKKRPKEEEEEEEEAGRGGRGSRRGGNGASAGAEGWVGPRQQGATQTDARQRRHNPNKTGEGDA